jgi:competence protein ComEC
LTACYFHLFSPVTLLANLAMVPLSSAALACSLGSLVFGAWCPPVSELFNHSAWFWMSLSIHGSEVFTQLPGAFFHVPTPAAADFVVYYGALVACLSGFALVKRRRIWTATAAVFIATFYFWRWHDAQQSTLISVLPLSGGSAIHCDFPGSRNDLLFDCGNTNSVVFATIPFLRSRGVNRLASFALSHGDIKSVGGAIPFLDSVRVEQTATSSIRFRSTVYRRIVQDLHRHTGRHRQVSRGEALGHWTVLHPPASAKVAQADDGALVLMGSCQGTRVLLLSDLSRTGQSALVESGLDLRAEVVVAGLPEKSEPLCDSLIERIAPELIVIVDSEFPATRRASAALRQRLGRHEIPVLYTRSSGAVTFDFRRHRVDAFALDGTHITLRRTNRKKNATN